jgi:hypothetical protein
MECIAPVNSLAMSQRGGAQATATVARARHNPNIFKIITEFSIGKTV